MNRFTLHQSKEQRAKSKVRFSVLLSPKHLALSTNSEGVS
ncbi:hypothetical protein BH10PAT3_BH10PAT3_3490 [soil metagenome]